MTDLVNALGFSDDEIKKCGAANGLLSIELEFTRKCNLKCLYCYTEAGKAAQDELTIDELKSVVSQARDLGAKRIILLGGGEPLIYDRLTDIVAYINSLGLQQVIFTNGTLITDDIARFLYEHEVSVIIKQNSLDPDIQDELAGVEGAFWRIKRGMEILRQSGYPNGKASLGLQTVICRQNIDEIPRMWVWARERNIIPYVEILTFQGRARNNSSLLVSSERTKALFEQLESIDSASFKIQWKTRPTIAAFSCKRHLYSSLVTAQGNVQPCTGVDIPVGNIREHPLREILSGSPVIRSLRNVYAHLEGECRDCRHSKECYGCRGNAYQMTGNYLASDPTCWHCEKVKNENPVYLCKQ
ncbi:MAG: radical SAM protein [Nitrospira bacterium SG8_35_4]|nr:MAG: radical SAM protein [Nitrospira bacterium SG8_35_4]